MSLGRTATFLDIYIERDLKEGRITEEQAQDLINEIGYEIDVLDGKVDVVPLESILNRIGFPGNWRDIDTM